MLLDVAIMAALPAFGNWKFHRFDSFLPVWKRLVKTVLGLGVTAVVSWYFGTKGVVIMMGVMMIPLVYVHGYWLPKNGVNGWTAEPREKYYALRGWKRDGSQQVAGGVSEHAITKNAGRSDLRSSC